METLLINAVLPFCPWPLPTIHFNLTSGSSLPLPLIYKFSEIHRFCLQRIQLWNSCPALILQWNQLEVFSKPSLSHLTLTSQGRGTQWLGGYGCLKFLGGFFWGDFFGGVGDWIQALYHWVIFLSDSNIDLGWDLCFRGTLRTLPETAESAGVVLVFPQPIVAPVCGDIE